MEKIRIKQLALSLESTDDGIPNPPSLESNISLALENSDTLKTVGTVLLIAAGVAALTLAASRALKWLSEHVFTSGTSGGSSGSGTAFSASLDKTSAQTNKIKTQTEKIEQKIEVLKTEQVKNKTNEPAHMNTSYDSNSIDERIRRHKEAFFERCDTLYPAIFDATNPTESVYGTINEYVHLLETMTKFIDYEGHLYLVKLRSPERFSGNNFGIDEYSLNEFAKKLYTAYEKVTVGLNPKLFTKIFTPDVSADAVIGRCHDFTTVKNQLLSANKITIRSEKQLEDLIKVAESTVVRLHDIRHHFAAACDKFYDTLKHWEKELEAAEKVEESNFIATGDARKLLQKSRHVLQSVMSVALACCHYPVAQARSAGEYRVRLDNLKLQVKKAEERAFLRY